MKDINWTEIWERLKGDTTTLFVNLIIIVIILVIARIILELLTRATTKVINTAHKLEDKRREKSIVTSMTLLRSMGRYFIYFVAICFIINQLGYGSILSNIVTAAGVGALVISFGAQSIIKDLLAGIFITFERQYGVGDYVKINEYEGTVLSVAMRCTYLQSWTGQKIIIPNGQVATVINYTGQYNMAVVDVPVSYEDDIKKDVKILEDVAKKYYKEHPDTCYEEPSVAAINSFDDSSIKITIYQKAKGRNHIGIQRDLRLLIKERFDKEGISIPYKQVVIHKSNE